MTPLQAVRNGWDGNRLRLFRQAKGLSQSSLAESLSVSSSYLSMLENRLRRPSEHLLRLLCLLHGVSLDWMIAGEGRMFVVAAAVGPRAKEHRGGQTLGYDRSALKAVIGLVLQATAIEGAVRPSDGRLELILNLYEKVIGTEADAARLDSCCRELLRSWD